MTDEGTVQEKIAVYGATGFTGGLICEELAARGVDFVAAGRNFEKLQSLSSRLGTEHDCVPTLRQASVDRPRSLDQLLEHIDILINCAGPFTEYGRPVVQAALRNRCHYLDTTGEQEFIRWVRDVIGQKAEAQGVVLLPSCAFEYATGTLVAATAVEEGARELGICYAATGMDTSPGTKRSIVRSISQGGVTLRDGRLRERKSADEVFEVAMPNGVTRQAAWFPGGEPLLVPEFTAVDRVETCLMMNDRTATLLNAVSGILPSVARVLEPAADALIRAVWGDGEAWDDSENPFQVIAFDPVSSTCYSAVSGYGPYLATARIITEAAIRLQRDEPETYGFSAIPKLFDAREFAASVDLDLV